MYIYIYNYIVGLHRLCARTLSESQRRIGPVSPILFTVTLTITSNYYYYILVLLLYKNVVSNNISVIIHIASSSGIGVAGGGMTTYLKPTGIGREKTLEHHLMLKQANL